MSQSHITALHQTVESTSTNIEHNFIRLFETLNSVDAYKPSETHHVLQRLDFLWLHWLLAIAWETTEAPSTLRMKPESVNSFCVLCTLEVTVLKAT